MRLSPPPLGSPPGLFVDTFEEGGQVFAILEWPARAAPDVGGGTSCDEIPDVPRAQREVLDLLLAGLSTAEIARRRRRSERTVAHQVDAIFRRLGVRSRLELFALAAGRWRLGGAP